MSEFFDNMSRELAGDITRRRTLRILGSAAAAAVAGRMLWPTRAGAQTPPDGTPCGTGQVTCGGVCTDIQTDAHNCGGCGNTCQFVNGAAQCVGGSCRLAACNAGWADCNNNPADGCETNIANDNNNCGACGHVCGAGTVCTNGVCGPPPAVAEVPQEVLVPAVGVAALGGGWWYHRRRQRQATTGGALPDDD